MRMLLLLRVLTCYLSTVGNSQILSVVDPLLNRLIVVRLPDGAMADASAAAALNWISKCLARTVLSLIHI